jgi:hypothetical protein
MMPRVLVLHLGLLAVVLASCSSHEGNPVVPPADDHPEPVRMITVVGTPHVNVNFAGSLEEDPITNALEGQFSVALSDSLGRRVFLSDVRLAGIPMHEELDGLGQPSRYTLKSEELPAGFEIGDTLVFSAGAPPFFYVIVPSHMTLPADSTVIHQNVDLTLPFTGIVERVLVTLQGQTGGRIRYNLQVENYTGQTSIFVPGADLAQLSVGPIKLGTNVRDDEVFLEGPYLQQITMQTTQNRDLRLEP